MTITDKGSFGKHIQRIKNRSNYLIAKMKYFTKDLSFENQYLIWTAYIRPYYQYICPLIDTQTATTQNIFLHKLEMLSQELHRITPQPPQPVP